MSVSELTRPNTVSGFMERGEHESVSGFVSEFTLRSEEVANPDTSHKEGCPGVRVHINELPPHHPDRNVSIVTSHETVTVIPAAPGTWAIYQGPDENFAEPVIAWEAHVHDDHSFAFPLVIKSGDLVASPNTEAVEIAAGLLTADEAIEYARTHWPRQASPASPASPAELAEPVH